MILEKQDVFIKNNEGKYWAFPIDHQENGFWLDNRSVYILTETQLETLKQEYYGIGIKYGQENK